MSRRRPAALVLLLLLGGCGFHPLYASAQNGAAGPAASGLAAISVGQIPDRTGQLLRLALEERFERSGLALAHLYDLNVTFSVSTEGIAIQTDTSNARVRIVGTATYQLIAQDPDRRTLTSGTARSMDGLNVFDQQPFAADLETEVVQRRVAEAVADEITQQLAIYFDGQPALAAR